MTRELRLVMGWISTLILLVVAGIFYGPSIVHLYAWLWGVIMP